MNTTASRNQSRLAKWGWGILLVVSALLLLNGVGWFFYGPSSSLSYNAQGLGLTTTEIKETYSTVAKSLETNARQVAIWYMAFGLLALIVTLEGFRRGSRFAWIATWVLVAVCAAAGIIELPGAFGFAMLGLATLTLVGQLLARSGVSPQTSSTINSTDGR